MRKWQTKKIKLYF
jgi:abhydrolase domain-containing protein 1/3